MELCWTEAADLNTARMAEMGVSGAQGAQTAAALAFGGTIMDPLVLILL